MIETNIKNLSVEEIMQKIKDEVNKIKNIENKDLNIKNINIINQAGQVFIKKDIYEYHDFTKYHDKEFIQNIYKALLKRDADESGLNQYLHLLRSGQRTKNEIITSLRFSKEGKIHNIKLLRAKRRYIKYVIARIPVVGKIYNVISSLLTIDEKMRGVYEYEAYTNIRFIEQKKELIELQNDINHTINNLNKQLKETVHENTLIEAQKDIDLKLGYKVDKNTLVKMEEGIDSKLKNKIDKNILIEAQKDIDLKLKNKVDENTLIQAQNNINSKLKNKVDENTLIQTQNNIDLKLKNKVDENTLIQAQNDIDLKLKEKVDIYHKNMKDSLEFVADDFLLKAIDKFNYPVKEFEKLNKNELYYSLFENIFYDSKLVKEKQKIYLDYIPKHNSKSLKHLDIGCGRGEFLLNLLEKKVYVKGIDINSIEIDKLLKDNFNVEEIDLIEYLSNTKHKFSSISALQVIEHLDYNILKEFIELSYNKISKNGVLILETINPHNSVSFNSFYMDETHKRPLPPEMIAFLLQWIGFKNIKFIYSSPLSKEYRMLDPRRNYHDYAVVGYKI